MRTAEQQKTDILATNILFAGLAISLVLSLLGLPNALKDPSFIGTLLIGYLAFAGFYFAIRKGITFFRLLFIIGQTAFILYSLVYYRKTLQTIGTSLFSITNYLAFYGSRIIALVLLLRTIRTQKA